MQPLLNQNVSGNEFFEALASDVKEAINEIFTEMPAKQKQPYISAETWELMEERTTALDYLAKKS